MNRYDAIEDIKYAETYTEQINVINSIFEYFESKVCSSCKHHERCTETYGKCHRNGIPYPTEYSWFCAGWESRQ
jgi:hypothetical protein